MATSRLSEVVEHLRRVVLLRECANLSDGQLLESFIARRDEAAFASLVRRHGPMVWGVCRRILGSHHHAEDAFQATFLVLVRKANSVVPREMVGHWLYGVAYQTARKARATAVKRGMRERQVLQMPEPQAAQHDLWRDLQPLLDLELNRLPEKYRVPVVLCDLEGKTRKEAAQQMKVPEGTVASRLARGRTMLARRLTRHGLAVSATTLTVTLAQNASAATVPCEVVYATIHAATLLAAGNAAAGAISAKVAVLTEGVLKTMLISKLKIASVVLFTATVLGTAVGTSGMLDRAAAKTGSPTMTKPPADIVWNEVEKQVRNLDLEQLQKSLKDTHSDIRVKHGIAHGIQDCKSCHQIDQGLAKPAENMVAKGETDAEKIKRLEQDVARLRGEKELLQMEVWILLKEIHRQRK